MASVQQITNIAPLTGTYTYATLPTGVLDILPGMFAFTSDAGMCAYDGTTWNICDVGQTRGITATGAVTALPTDRHLGLNKTTGAASAVALYTPVAAGHRITVSDWKGDANTNNITITPASGNIDASATYVISTAFGSWTGYWTGTIWKTECSR